MGIRVPLYALTARLHRRYRRGQQWCSADEAWWRLRLITAIDRARAHEFVRAPRVP